MLVSSGQNVDSVRGTAGGWLRSGGHIPEGLWLRGGGSGHRGQPGTFRQQAQDIVNGTTPERQVIHTEGVGGVFQKLASWLTDGLFCGVSCLTVTAHHPAACPGTL